MRADTGMALARKHGVLHDLGGGCLLMVDECNWILWRRTPHGFVGAIAHWHRATQRNKWQFIDHRTLGAAISAARYKRYEWSIGGTNVVVEEMYNRPSLWRQFKVTVNGKEVWGGAYNRAWNALVEGAIQDNSPAVLLDWVADHTREETPTTIVIPYQ